jgi:hypothetical protein
LKKYVLLFIWLAIPFVLIVLPKEFFDEGQTICLFTLATGKNCLGCGMTKAIMRCIHFDFYAAFHKNPFSLIIFPLFVFVYVKIGFVIFKKICNTNPSKNM